MNRQVILLFALISLVISQQTPPCSCKNQGVCLPLNNSQTFCSCPQNFIDKQCQIESSEINENKQTFNITSEHSYFNLNFNTTSVYLIQLFLCPIQFTIGTRFELFMEFQKEDGSLSHNTPDTDLQTFVGVPLKCLVVKSVLIPPANKKDGSIPNLVIRMRQILNEPAQLKSQNPIRSLSLQLKDTATKENQFVKSSKMSITAYTFLIYDLENWHLGQFVLMFSISMLCITTIAFVIFRKVLQRRINRYRFQPAEISARDISHFDTLMPPKYHPEGSTTNSDEEEDQCMICLLGVENTYTRLTPCKHLFHQECLDEWGKKSLTCPACRAPLANQSAHMIFRSI